MVIICEASIENNARYFRENYDGCAIFLQNNGYVHITYQSSGDYYYSPNNCVIIENRTEEVKEFIDLYINDGLRWESYGAHYRCETNNDISFWCFELSNDLFNPIVFSKERLMGFDIKSLQKRYDKSLPLYRAKAMCVKWLEELIQLDYDVSEWLQTKRSS